MTRAMAIVIGLWLPGGEELKPPQRPGMMITSPEPPKPPAVSEDRLVQADFDVRYWSICLDQSRRRLARVEDYMEHTSGLMVSFGDRDPRLRPIAQRFRRKPDPETAAQIQAKLRDAADKESELLADLCRQYIVLADEAKDLTSAIDDMTRAKRKAERLLKEKS